MEGGIFFLFAASHTQYFISHTERGRLICEALQNMNEFNLTVAEVINGKKNG